MDLAVQSSGCQLLIHSLTHSLCTFLVPLNETLVSPEYLLRCAAHCGQCMVQHNAVHALRVQKHSNIINIHHVDI